MVRKGDWLVKIDLTDYYLNFDLAAGTEGRWGGMVGVQGGSVWVLEVSGGGGEGVTGDCEEVEEEVWSEGDGVGG